MSVTELVCAAPSQQRLRRSSVAAATPSQLRRGSAVRSISSVAAASAPRDAQNERDGAGPRSSFAAATPSQLRRSSAAHTMSMSGRRGIEQPLGKICHSLRNTTTTANPSFSKIILPKELRSLPCQGFFWGGVKKSCGWVYSDPQNKRVVASPRPPHGPVILRARATLGYREKRNVPR